MDKLPDFICVSCNRSLLLEANIMLDSKNRQLCVKCWRTIQKSKPNKLEVKYPPGSQISWISDDMSRSRSGRRTGTVVKCSETRIRVKFGSHYSWIDEEAVYVPAEEK